MEENKKTSYTSEQEKLKKIIKEHVHSIRKNILFRDFPLNYLVKLLITCKQNHYNAGDVIFHEDDPSTSMAIILKGTVSISKEGSKICDLHPPALLGEIGLFTAEPRNATVDVIDDVLSLTITKGDLNDFIEREPKSICITFYRNVADCLGNKINNDNRHLMVLQEENLQLKELLKEKELPERDKPVLEEKEVDLPQEKEKDSKGKKQDRKYVRVAISNRSVCHIKVEEKKYDVKNLSLGGININTRESCWASGDIIKGEIILKDGSPFQFASTVRSVDDNICGLQFNRVPIDLENAITKTVNFLQKIGNVI